MLAYHNDPSIKQQILEQLQRHYDADEIVKGQYWENGKGCAVGCTLHTDQHSDYESRFGIPQVLAHIEDAIFEGLPNDLAKDWPIRFMASINVGADLSTVWREFAIWLLIDHVDGVIKYTQPGTDAHRVIMQVAQLYQQEHTQKQMRAAAYDARAVVHASDVSFAAALTRARLQKHSLVEAVRASDASFADAYDAYDAASYAASYSASYAAEAAYDAAAAAAAAAASAASAAAYIKMSNKLIELLQKQEVTC